jgi:hypothetical protein
MVVALRMKDMAKIWMMWMTREKTPERYLILEDVASILAVSTPTFFYSKY